MHHMRRSQIVDEPLQLPPLDEADSVATLIRRLLDGLRFPLKKDLTGSHEPEMRGIGIEPSFGIGQRAYLFKTLTGYIL